MGQLIVGLVIGLVVGALAGWALVTVRSRSGTGDAAATQAELTASRQRAGDLESQLERERAEHQAAIAQLGDRFKVLADEALNGVVTSFRQSQEEVFKQREVALDERLNPLDVMLRDYQNRVRELDEARQKGLLEVQHATERLTEAQVKVMDETQKLNTILGRSSHRGRWGEIQLQRILEYSGMQKHIDFDPQFTVKGDGDLKQRPDVVVNLPHGASIAIDSKVPYEAFDRAMAATDDAVREAALTEYAGALRSHIGDLKKKSYSDALAVSPNFVVCFVPSDYLLSAAFEADHTLLEGALESKVLVAGPTTLLGLLWAAYLGWSQFDAAENTEEIRRLSETLVERTSVFYNHLGRLGASIENSTKSYNQLVGSLEDRLLVTVREIQRHGVKQQRELAAVDPVPGVPRVLDPRRWPEGAADEGVIDAEVVAPLDPGELTP